MTIALAVIAYLIGSVSFAVLVSRAMGLPDPRSYGSKNPGATNVLRTGKRTAAALTLFGDAAKGWLAVFLTDYFFATTVPPVYKMAPVAIAVMLGHMYPVFHRFRGGSFRVLGLFQNVFFRHKKFTVPGLWPATFQCLKF